MARLPKLEVPEGFTAGGVHAGLKPAGRLDLGIILCDRPTIVAAVTTTNRFPAAPVLLCRKRVAPRPWLRGVVVNSANANAMTGPQGEADALAMTQAAEDATGAPRGSFLVASTGVIGEALPIDRIRKAMPKMTKAVSSAGWLDFAGAILTTDRLPKIATASFAIRGRGRIRLLGVAKGSGMIEPNMATLLGFIVTDFPVAPGKARRLLREACDPSFHCLTIDGQSSTNDTVLLFSSSTSEKAPRLPAGTEQAFLGALTGLCQDLCRQLAADGEGATKLITVDVRGANTGAQSRRLAKSIARSPLVKTAMAGEDPNWGRIVQALGQAGVPFSTDKVSIRLQGVHVVRGGNPCSFKRSELCRALKRPEILIEIAVGDGKASSRVWTSDLTGEYVRINTRYN